MLNYKQLYYFWQVAKHGGVARAAEHLHLTPQTISGQINELAHALGVELFQRSGRTLALTPAGQLAFSHAEEIFAIGSALEALVKGQQEEQDLAFRVGVSDVIPKSIAYQLLAPAMRIAEPVRLLCHEDKLQVLFEELAAQTLDLVIADRPLEPKAGVKGFCHLVGESPVAFYGIPDLARQYGSGFPQSLHGAPLLLPGTESALRPSLDRWFAQQRITPRIRGEFDDSALMKAFAQEGAGLFPAPLVIAHQARRQHGVDIVGTAPEVICRYYAISTETRLHHPAVSAISHSVQSFHLREQPT